MWIPEPDSVLTSLFERGVWYQKGTTPPISSFSAPTARR